jgi:hypothetical protein
MSRVSSRVICRKGVIFCIINQNLHTKYSNPNQTEFVNREEAQNKMMALKDRSEKDIAQQEVEMKGLNRLIDHDNQLKEFMAFKASERSELREEEEAKKRKCKFTPKLFRSTKCA